MGIYGIICGNGFQQKEQMATTKRQEAKGKAAGRVVLVGTYRKGQLQRWRGWYNYPISAKDTIPESEFAKVNELWLFLGTAAQKTYKAEFVGVKTREELIKDYGYPAKGKGHGEKYLLFKTEFKYLHRLDNPLDCEKVIVRTKDFARSPKVAKQLKTYLASPERNDPDLASMLPSIVTKLPPAKLCVSEAAVQLNLFSWECGAPRTQVLDNIGDNGNSRMRTGVVIGRAEVRRRLGLSRHNLERCIQRGYLSASDDDLQFFDEAEILTFQQSQEYQDILNGTIDERNTLNDLTGKEWIPETKSYMFQRGLGASHPHAQIEIQHPAPFSFQDIQSLISFFTKKGMSVLDPFGGVGSTAKACDIMGRKCTSIELSPKYHKLSLKRLETEIGAGASARHTFLNGDSCVLLPTLPLESFDFVVTSPPYWGILHKRDQKVIHNRVNNHLDTQYSQDTRDLGNVSDYGTFLAILCDKIFMQCARVLRSGKYMAIIVSDFRDKGNFVSFHSDLIHMLNMRPIVGDKVLSLQGTKILIQSHKSLHPYGYPFSYVENIHHQYILIFRKI